MSGSVILLLKQEFITPGLVQFIVPEGFGEEHIMARLYGLIWMEQYLLADMLMFMYIRIIKIHS